MQCYACRLVKNVLQSGTLNLVRQGSTNLEHIQIIKKVGGKLTDSYLDEGTPLNVASECESQRLRRRLHPGQDHRGELPQTAREGKDSDSEHM